MDNKDELLSQFTDVTGVDTERGRFYLESSAWQLEVALASFYENDGDDNPIIDEPEPAQVGDEPAQPTSVISEPKPRIVKPSSRFGTVAGLSQGRDSSDEEEGQAFYAGGSEHSGQQVIGPGKKKKDIVSEMFKSVQEHGAEVVDPRNPIQTGRASTFAGTGYRLGQSSSDTEVVGPLSSSRRPSNTEVTLKLWKDGFSVNEGAIREYADPDNREFLEFVRRGEVPPELVREARGSEVHLNMEDHRHDDFVQMTPKLKAFAGKGHVLGSPSPATIGITKPLDETDRIANEQAARTTVPVDENAPTTTIQIRLADGSRLVAHLNNSHTIGDVRRFIVTARPQYEHQSFSLLTTFPSKELADSKQTLDDAGILNSAVLQRLT